MNDRYGHLFGDAYLIEVAKIIQTVFGKEAVVGRIGGDEFIAFTKDHLDSQGTEQKAKQLIEALAALQLPGIQTAASCSIGIAQAPQHGLAFKTFYYKADCALYQAKRQGKNRCVFMMKPVNRISMRVFHRG